MSTLEWLTATNLVLTAAVAVIGVLIAMRQTITARNSVRFSLYEKRIKVYDEMRSALARIAATGKTGPDVELEFLTAVQHVRWLFDDDIADFVNTDLWHTLCELWLFQSQLEHCPVGPERVGYSQRQADASKQLFEQRKQLDEKFGKFLRLGD